MSQQRAQEKTVTASQSDSEMYEADHAKISVQTTVEKVENIIVEAPEMKQLCEAQRKNLEAELNRPQKLERRGIWTMGNCREMLKIVRIIAPLAGVMTEGKLWEQLRVKVKTCIGQTAGTQLDRLNQLNRQNRET